MNRHPSFIRLNFGWNADPNAPEPDVKIEPGRHDVVVRFRLNYFQYPKFEARSRGALRFIGCTRYRLGGTNDEGWYLGQCRYSKIAPAWGEFYEIAGADPERLRPHDWIVLDPGRDELRHFLFYFRDGTFECMATDWKYDESPGNAVGRVR